MDGWRRWWEDTGRSEVADLLLRDWDVLGVEVFEEEAKGEYSDEVEQLAPLLRADAGLGPCADRLTRLGQDLTARPDTARDQKAAESVLAWYARVAPRGSQQVLALPATICLIELLFPDGALGRELPDHRPVEQPTDQPEQFDDECSDHYREPTPHHTGEAYAWRSGSNASATRKSPITGSCDRCSSPTSTTVTSSASVSCGRRPFPALSQAPPGHADHPHPTPSSAPPPRAATTDTPRPTLPPDPTAPTAPPTTIAPTPPGAVIALRR